MKEIILVFGLMVLLFGCVGETPAQQGTGGTSVDIPVGEAAEQAMEAQQTQETAAPPETAVTEPETTVTEPSPLDSIDHKELKFRTKDGWEVYGTVYYSSSANPTTLIILIPMLGADRSSYDALIPSLHEEIPYADVIAMDMRGHGKSANLGSYTRFQTGDFRAMKNDIDPVVSFFSVSRPTVKNYYLVGASMGSSVALDYAVEHGEVSKLVMISPGIEYQGFDISEDAGEYLHGLYLMASYEDTYSAESVSTIYSSCPSDAKEKKMYDGVDAHGTGLFEATKDNSNPAVDVIVKWIK